MYLVYIYAQEFARFYEDFPKVNIKLSHLLSHASATKSF